MQQGRQHSKDAHGLYTLERLNLVPTVFQTPKRIAAIRVAGEHQKSGHPYRSFAWIRAFSCRRQSVLFPSQTGCTSGGGDNPGDSRAQTARFKLGNPGHVVGFVILGAHAPRRIALPGETDTQRERS